MTTTHQTTTNLSPAERAKILKRITRIAKVMDTAIGIPGTRFRFGADSIIGLIPGAGDLVSMGISVYTLTLAAKLGAPKPLLVKMAANIAIDTGLGSIPVLGDIFDAYFKSNSRNLQLLQDYLKNHS
jgi:Domain of unknown function (DUF4112)